MGTNAPSSTDLPQSPGTPAVVVAGDSPPEGRSRLRSSAALGPSCPVCLGSPLCICTPQQPLAKAYAAAQPPGRGGGGASRPPSRTRPKRKRVASRQQQQRREAASTATGPQDEGGGRGGGGGSATTPPERVSERGRPPEYTVSGSFVPAAAVPQSRRQLFKAYTGDNLGVLESTTQLSSSSGSTSIIICQPEPEPGPSTKPKTAAASGPGPSSNSSPSSSSSSSSSSSTTSNSSSCSSSSSSISLQLPSATTTATAVEMTSSVVSSAASPSTLTTTTIQGERDRSKRGMAPETPPPQPSMSVASTSTRPTSSSSGRVRHACPKCPKTFGSPGKLSQHMYSHTGERPFACQHCGKAFSSKFKLVRHALIHSDLRQYVCPICERTFHRKDHLKNHAKVHNPVKSVYTCDRPGCGKEYSSLLSYRKHAAVHSAEDGNLECAMCGMRFANKDEIVFHLKVHAGSRTVKTAEDRKYRCERCDRSFFTGKDVRRHMVVHTGKRDFLCQFCPQRFGRKDHLVRHIKKSHNNTGKKAKAKRAEAKTKSVKSILAEVVAKGGPVPSTSTTVGLKSEEEQLLDDASAIELPPQECNLEETSIAYAVEVKPICSGGGETGDGEDDIVVFEGTASMVSVGQEGITSPDGTTMLRSPDGDTQQTTSTYVLDPFSTLDIKPDTDMISIEQLPLLILPPAAAAIRTSHHHHLHEHGQSSVVAPPDHQQQFLGPDEEAQQLSRHIMNLSAPGTSGDTELIIGMPSFLTSQANNRLAAAPANTTPLPRFNQAFTQQQQPSGHHHSRQHPPPAS